MKFIAWIKEILTMLKNSETDKRINDLAAQVSDLKSHIIRLSAVVISTYKHYEDEIHRKIEIEFENQKKNEDDKLENTPSGSPS